MIVTIIFIVAVNFYGVYIITQPFRAGVPGNSVTTFATRENPERSSLSHDMSQPF